MCGGAREGWRESSIFALSVKKEKTYKQMNIKLEIFIVEQKEKKNYTTLFIII